MRRPLPLTLPLLWLLLSCVQPAGARAAAIDDETAEAPSPALSDSLLLAAPDFAPLRSELLPLTTARVAEVALALVPRLVTLDRPDLLVEFLEFWEDRCGASEPTMRTRILAAIWDGAFDESLYDEDIAVWLDDWEWRDPALLSDGRNEFDAFTILFADQLLPHQDEGSLPEYFCLLYSDRLDEAAALLATEGLAATWVRWYRDHPDGADGGEVLPAAEGDEGAAGGEPASDPSSLLLTVGGWWPNGDVELAGYHMLVGGLLEQRFGDWFLRMPIEVRLGRTTRPYRVDQDGVSGYSDRFDALYLGVEGGLTVAAQGTVALELFAGLGYDGIRPFIEEDVALATLNVNLGMGLRWHKPGGRPLVGLDVRREWLGTRNEGPDSLSGGAWSLRVGLGMRFGPLETASAADSADANR